MYMECKILTYPCNDHHVEADVGSYWLGETNVVSELLNTYYLLLFSNVDVVLLLV